MMRHARRIAVVACAAALTLQTACYSYQPIARPLSPSSQRLRLHLTPDGTTELAKYLGPRVALVEGVLADVQPDGALSVAVEWVQTVDGSRQPWTGEGRVAFPAAYVGSVQQHTLSPRRSAIAAVSITGAVIALAVIALRTVGSQGGGGDGTGGPPP